MLQSVDKLAEAIAHAEQHDDLERLRELENYFRAASEPSPLPFVPAVALNEAQFGDEVSAEESAAAIPLATALSRALRRVAYRRKLSAGYNGPIIVSEGDSWFQYPIRLQDVVDHLMQEFAVFSLGFPGDLLTNMVNVDEFTKAIERERAQFFLFSGGGNDMLHSGRLREFLVDFQEGMTAAEAIDFGQFGVFKAMLAQTYRDLVGRLAQRFPSLTILIHGYDYALPCNGGTWLGTPLESRNVPPNMWPAVIERLIDEFNAVLLSLESMFPGHVFHIDGRGRVGNHRNSWFDELHPKDAGFQRVAERFAERIRTEAESIAVPGPEIALARAQVGREIDTRLPAARKFAQVASRQASPGMPEVATPLMAQSLLSENMPPGIAAEAIIAPPPGRARLRARRPAHPPTVPVDFEARRIVSDLQLEAVTSAAPAPELQHPCGSLQLWQAQLSDEDRIAYRHYLELERELSEPDSAARMQTRSELQASSDLFSFERVIGDSNIYQINFLSRGERAARAVGRVSVVNKYGIPMGSGTGTLVSPGLLLTNNHVIGDPDLAANSYVLLDYEYDADNGLKQTERFDFTSDVFFTDRSLDFTFISVASTGRTGRDLPDYGWLLLIRESGKALKGEYVSIVQHANGLPKQIALRDSMIVGRREHYIYYRTDTNPGSSGAPVVNDEWFPVALHHRTVPDLENPCQFVANRGIRISSIYERLDWAANNGNGMARQVLSRIDPGQSASLSSTELPAGAFDADAGILERLVEPFHDAQYDNRNGYDEDYLGIRVPLPQVRNANHVSRRQDNADHVIPYEHFSIVMFKSRRLALFTASNVDANLDRQRPEAGYNYSRRGLSGLGENDIEKWFMDPRVPRQDQLPDRFFTNDQRAFDKGHIVRRTDVTWGQSFEEVRRANGDTYHLTNCSPQVAGFNRSQFNGLWGELENIIFDQADTERMCILAGPILDPSDPSFRGQDAQGEALVQIPAKYWKVVVVRESDHVNSFAFLLEQDLRDVPLEFQVNAEWQRCMISIPALEVLVRHFRFPQVIHDSDQASQAHGERLRRLYAMDLLA